MATKRPHSYPADFRQKAVQLARAGRRLADLAAEFELGRQTVRNCIKQADLDAGRRSDGLTIERDILSKAAAWFARETDSGRSTALSCMLSPLNIFRADVS